MNSEIYQKINGYLNRTSTLRKILLVDELNSAQKPRYEMNTVGDNNITIYYYHDRINSYNTNLKEYHYNDIIVNLKNYSELDVISTQNYLRRFEDKIALKILEYSSAQNQSIVCKNIIDFDDCVNNLFLFIEEFDIIAGAIICNTETLKFLNKNSNCRIFELETDEISIKFNNYGHLFSANVHINPLVQDNIIYATPLPNFFGALAIKEFSEDNISHSILPIVINTDCCHKMILDF